MGRRDHPPTRSREWKGAMGKNSLRSKMRDAATFIDKVKDGDMCPCCGDWLSPDDEHVCDGDQEDRGTVDIDGPNLGRI